MSRPHLHAVGDDAGTPHDLTIEQLATETGLTVRNIRSHRERGLLQPPVVRDKIGFYGAEHVARLKLVRELQAEGFNLKAIRRLVDRAPETSDQILSALELVQQPFETEQPQVLRAEDLQRRFRLDDATAVLERAHELGVLLPLGEGRYEAPAPSLIDVAEELAGRGVPVHHALAVVAKVRESCRTVAKEFIRLFLDDIFGPFEAEGMPAERWPQIVESIERLRPMSAQVVLAMYQLTMTAEVEKATAQQFARMAERKR